MPARYNSAMNARRRRAELLALAEKLGLEVRLEPLEEGQAGGLCRLAHRWLLVVDERADLQRQGDHLLAAIADFARRDTAVAEKLDEFYLLPELRQELEAGI